MLDFRGWLRPDFETLPARVRNMRSVGRKSAFAALVIGISLFLGVVASPAASAASPLASTASTASTASATVNGSFGLRVVHQPSDDVTDPRGYYYIVSSVKPGTVVHRQLELDNNSSQAGQVQVYAGAASVSHGQFMGAPGRTQNQLSFWVGVTPSTPVIGSGSVASINVTITVPANASPGAYYGVVWAQMQGTGGPGVSLASRVGIRIYFTVLAGQ